MAVPREVSDAPIAKDPPQQLPAILHPWIDSILAPVYIVTFPAWPSDEDVVAFCEGREAWALSSQFPVAWVVDLTAIREASAKQRKLFAEHLGRFEPHDIAHNCGSAIVVSSAFLRGLATAVFWLKSPKFPHQMFETRQEAIRWATNQLRQRNAQLGPGTST